MFEPMNHLKHDLFSAMRSNRSSDLPGHTIPVYHFALAQFIQEPLGAAATLTPKTLYVVKEPTMLSMRTNIGGEQS